MLPNVQYRKPVRGSLVWWLRFFGIVTFVVILLRLPHRQEVQLAHIDLRWLGFAMLLTVAQLLLEAFVWQLLLAIQRIRHPYPKTILAYLASQYLGLVTPGHVGEFLAPGYISMDTGITFGYALSSVVMKKILGWVTVVGFGVWGLPLLAQVGVRQVVWVTAVALVALSGGIAVWVFSLRRLAKKWRKLSPWQIDMDEFWAGMRRLTSAPLAAALAMSVLAFGILFFQVDAVLRALGIALPLVLIAKMLALSRIAARLAPISLVGFGSKDAVLIFLLAQQGIEISVGITVALLLLLTSYLVTLLLSGLCWWIRPLVVRRAARASS